MTENLVVKLNFRSSKELADWYRETAEKHGLTVGYLLRLAAQRFKNDFETSGTVKNRTDNFVEV